MNPHPALVELTDLWYELPSLVGASWPELRPRLLAAVEELATASPQEYERKALALLKLLLAHAEVKRRLAPALIGKTIPTDRAAEPQESTGTQPVLHLARRAGVLFQNDERQDTTGRYINAEVQPDDPDRPGTLLLAFDLADIPRDATTAAPLGHLGDPGTFPTTLTVEVSSSDAEVEPLSDTFTVPREGPSPDRACFRVTPTRTGTLQLTAVFLRGDSLVQWMLLNVTGHQMRVRTQGPSLETVGQVRDRGLSVRVWPAADGRHYEIVVSGGIGHGCQALLRKESADLDRIAREARLPLQALVRKYGQLNDSAAQPTLELPQDDYTFHTGQLAEAGCRMFRSLFFDGEDAQLQEVGRRIQEYLTGPASRSVQFVTDRPLLPWHLMCPVEHMRDADFRQILGLRHQVDCIPLIRNAGNGVTEATIETRPRLNVTLALNRSIDRGGTRDLVAKQEAYWRDYHDKGLASLTVRDRQETILNVLRGSDEPAGILYLYCHATAHDPDDNGPAYAALAVEGTAGDIMLRSLLDHGSALPGSPVIVLNACRTAFTSPLSTVGFLTYFLERSRGVLGTEADTPASFAAAWATSFFDRLLAGERMGEAVRATREHFAFTRRNPLGLLYALYCNGDTVLAPAVVPR
ncbi:CHAT domain-containing protein [Streptomyces europaeiscabiei]|uniref:CHAT domain-containing protein n=1 Tax=Streptomyces europaeiscabiei TaxID=146819 RepID=UPI0029A4FAC7|nr:CHAT domain-containing protein [Streptomyces europaeiscabiei]MDX2525152.1 CHAT domain-containing protein [Streptomyces europaeiscabiei]